MKILIAMQGRYAADNVLNWLRQHSWPVTSEFYILGVVEPPYYGSYIDLEQNQQVWKNTQESVDAVVESVKKVIAGTKVQGLITEGNPAEEIVRACRNLPADLVILGSHGRGKLGKMLWGSVSMAVLNDAPCSVLVLKQAAKNPAAAEPDNVPVEVCGETHP